jgi:DNA-binding NarL/FixJ family response regulator
MKRISLVIVDDHALFRAGLIGLLNDMADFEVIGEAANGRDAIDLVRAKRPDVILLDVNMPGMNGVEVVEELKPRTECSIIMLTISKHEDDLFGAINAGADGYLLKNAEPEELRRAILNVHEGKSVLSPEVTRQVMKIVSNMQGYLPDKGLSKRELEVLAQLSQGKTTASISDELFISENTVKTHIRHILEKLEAANRAEAVSKATQLGLIKQI